MKTKTEKFFGMVILAGVISFALIPAMAVAETPYTLLEPLPYTQNVDTGGNQPNPTQYMERVYYFGLSIAVVLALVMLVIAGVEYTAAGISPPAKEDAKKRIEYALYGLLLALASWLLLNTINPKLTHPSLEIDILPTGSATGSTTTRTQCVPYTPEQIQQDNVLKQMFRNADIYTNAGYCNTSCSTGCTNLAGLPSEAIVGIKNLKIDCDKAMKDEGGCDIRITGGTEALHGSHGPGKAVVDLGLDENLSKFFYRKYKEEEAAFSVNDCLGNFGNTLPDNLHGDFHDGCVINYDGGTYTYEKSSRNNYYTGPHWHVEY